ncbi:MAG TPA: histidine kinase N-terminal domain-containing protein [Bacillota bacterium]|nr:histidine kinase N-terminal domain-containing protein [Bacillota bacterium]
MEGGVSELVNIRNRIAEYLDLHSEEMLEQWYSLVITSEKDQFNVYIKENGKSMFHLVLQYLTGQTTLDHIQRLAEKVACERVQAEVNIGEFVYNINQGRNIFLTHLPFKEITLAEIQSSIEKINESFDSFLYHAVIKYTEFKNTILEERTRFIERTHKERLTILGQMSSSFVHEFRNPLTSIMGFLKLLRSRYPSLEYLDIMSHELNQLNFRISQFLLFSKKEIHEDIKIECNLTALIEETLEFLYPSIVDGEVEVLTELDPMLMIYASQNQIRQIIINLIINSIDALQYSSKKRKLYIQTINDGNSIQVFIRNNGPQIPPELKKTIFEPFFTTKDLGTGLGLYVCKQIMEKHLGIIRCESDDEQTTFSLHFPIPNSSLE